MIESFWQIFRYGVVGAGATVVDYAAYYLFTRGLGLTVFYANPLAYATGNIISFIGHRTITFHSHGRPAPQYVRFIIVTIVGLLISQAVIVSVVYLGIHDLAAKAVSIIFSGAFNYLANKYWTFK